MSRVSYIHPAHVRDTVIEGVAYREPFGTEHVRTAFFAREGGRLIVQAKLIIPCSVVDLEHQRLRAFIAAMRARQHGPTCATVM